MSVFPTIPARVMSVKLRFIEERICRRRLTPLAVPMLVMQRSVGSGVTPGTEAHAPVAPSCGVT